MFVDLLNDADLYQDGSTMAIWDTGNRATKFVRTGISTKSVELRASNICRNGI